MKNNTSVLLFLLYPKKLRKTMANIIKIRNKMENLEFIILKQKYKILKICQILKYKVGK
ncbi:hypothetical protein QRY39_00730 [Campylobacter jejuni]|uniref:hypothetical protein n=1 Tax=Campylobacter jejuni TaxID=197 RepID=UPI0029457A8C|nr:hypothetical protein [Campylobacter jejuni]MEA8918227.1 hypothetical protein [Campylobacter jejuni]MEA8936503.1 hypothetical protein [Campylobacter jejuni]MEA8943709.1 hypothetical protein [Campylobacter jejuni]MEA8952673.1 hypothetical protein [Campylobacter jejuni]MEA8967895.1 hypothetical protein [Campylobacter jejuni]